MELKDALAQTQQHEGWSDEYVAVLTGRSANTVKRWQDGASRMPGDAVITLQKASERFRSLTLGAVA